MSTENITIEQHLTFVNKMRERVKGTDLEPIWERLHAYMTKINDLNEEKKAALDTMIKKIIAKIQHFKNISEQRLEAINAENKNDQELDAQFEFSNAAEPPSSSQIQGSSSQTDNHQFIKPKQKLKKFKRFKMTRQVHPHIVMSPRGDNIPVMRIKFSEVHNRKRQKEEKKRNKKVKDVDVLKAALEQYERSKQLPIEDQELPIVENVTENQPVIGNVVAAENAVQNPHDSNIPMEEINQISSVLNPIHENRLSNLELKDCSIRIERFTPEKAKSIPDPRESQSTKSESVTPSKNGTKSQEILPKIPIEKSKSIVQNGSKKVDGEELIYIVDSDDDDSVEAQTSTKPQQSTLRKMLRLRSKSLYAEPPSSSTKVKASPNVQQKQTKSPDKASKVTKSSLSPQQALEDAQQKSDNSCIVTVKTVDLPIKPQASVKNPPTSSNPKTPTTTNVSSNHPELLKSLIKTAPVAKTQGTKRNRNSLDTLPSPKKISQTAQNTSIRQSARQAVRRSSAAKIIDFEQPSSEENLNKIVITSVETIQQPTSSFKKISIDQPQAVPKKLPNARKSTASNKVVLSREMTAPSQSPINSNVKQVATVNAEKSELNISKVSSASDLTNVQQNAVSAIKNEPMSPGGYMSPPMTEIPTSIVMVEAQKDKKLVLLSAAATLNKIRPWLMASEHRKFLKNCENMLANGFCLSALFKCMGSTCSYFTNNPTFFLRHLKMHQQKQANDMKYFSQCAYCSFMDDNPQSLIQHISDTHGYSRYQCAYCFYRSCDFHISTHHKLFHPLKSEVIIECNSLKTLNIEKEFSNALSNVMKVCKPIFCCVCKFKFYNIKNFENHYKAYKSVPSSRCLVCKFEITQETIIDHLKECHKFGDFNCAFCFYASDSSDSIKIHLSNMHYDKPMLYYDRTKQSQNIDLLAKGSTKAEDVLKSVVLKKLIHQEQSNTKNIKIFNDQNELENAHNINTGLLENHK
ncbi:uncharacterized protein [Chironomus tepperi]|uniref:uncharacterized protein n=1 Tax=Chironomus tepperi TaxID=113505 RepID=UPI00391EEDE7